MEEIFNDWLISERDAEREGKQGATVVLTWAPVISRWSALWIFLAGARMGQLAIATIKVVEVIGGQAKLLIRQQKEAETSERQFGDALARGRTVTLTPHIDSLENAQKIANDLMRLADTHRGSRPPFVS